MPDYRYTALDRAGKEVSCTLVGRDTMDAAGKVRALGYYPVNVLPAGNGMAAGIARQVVAVGAGRARPIIEGGSRARTESPAQPAGKRVGRVHILLFTRELADLIDAGLPIDRALSVLIEQS